MRLVSLNTSEHITARRLRFPFFDLTGLPPDLANQFFFCPDILVDACRWAWTQVGGFHIHAECTNCIVLSRLVER